jgi:hypothetical protein
MEKYSGRSGRNGRLALVNRAGGNRPKLPSPKKVLPGKSNSAKKEFTAWVRIRTADGYSNGRESAYDFKPIAPPIVAAGLFGTLIVRL